MLTPILNELQLKLKIVATGPMLIRDGRMSSDEQRKKLVPNETVRQNLPDSIFVCRNTYADLKDKLNKNDINKLKFYLPRTSLRGLLRQQAESIMRMLSSDQEDPLCCNPFDETNCAERIEKALLRLHDRQNRRNRLSAVEIFNASCAICRLFGSTAMASRIEVDDGVPQGMFAYDERVHVAIDRFTGGSVPGALFKDFVLSGAFETEIRIRNFEIWQLGLLAYVLRDLENGDVPVGSGKNKGYGQATIVLENITLKYRGKHQPNQLLGMADFPEISARRYDFKKHELTQYPIESQVGNGLLSQEYVIQATPTSVIESRFWQVCAGVFNGIVRNAAGADSQRFQKLSELCISDGTIVAQQTENEEQP